MGKNVHWWKSVLFNFIGECGLTMCILSWVLNLMAVRKKYPFLTINITSFEKSFRIKITTHRPLMNQTIVNGFFVLGLQKPCSWKHGRVRWLQFKEFSVGLQPKNIGYFPICQLKRLTRRWAPSKLLNFDFFREKVFKYCHKRQSKWNLLKGDLD